MAEKPSAHNASPASTYKPPAPKSAGNPAFRMMGIPNFKFKLPSRNWLIFWTITGSFAATLLYDRHHKKRAQQKWCNLVSHIAEERLPPSTMPRRITIFLAAPPGDSLRAAREHFHEYIKPILVAGALDWEVIEGRREGDVRAGLAEKVRKLRRRKGEKCSEDTNEENQQDESTDQLLYELRQKAGTKDWDGVQGDLILGRHTWKEYIRGLHEGWLGPLTEPQLASQTSEIEPSPQLTVASNPSTESSPTGDSMPENPTSEQIKPPETSPEQKPKPKPTPTPPYIHPTDYPSCSIPPTLNNTIPPSLALPLPHLLGFLNTPTRLYRFLTRRHLAETTGRSVAALVLASHTQEYNRSTDYTSATDLDDSSPSAGNQADPDAVAIVREIWEQEAVLKQEEADWHKSAWKANAEGEERERVWQEAVVVDERIGQRMRMFELARGEEERAEEVDAKKRREEEGLVQRARKRIGWVDEGRKGWEMGLEGDEKE